MAKLKRLKIEKFRNVVPGTELCFNDGYNVLLGQNGTGKTTLLKLIARVLSSDFSGLEGEAFAVEYEIETRRATLFASIRNEPRDGLDPSLAALRAPMVDALTGQQAMQTWSYEVRFELRGQERSIAVMANPLRATGSAAPENISRPVPIHPPFEPSGLLMTLYEASLLVAGDGWVGIFGGTGWCVRFDEALGDFDALTGVSSDAAKVVVVASDRASIPLPGRRTPFILAKYVVDGSLSGRERVVVSRDGADFLAHAIKFFCFDDGDMTLSLQSRKVEGDQVRLEYGKFAFTFTLDDGSIITHDALSYGQKRLLSFLYHLALNEDVIIADELVNGLHYDWIEACIEEIGTRQAFLTSQNPILLDFLPFESAEQVRRSFLLCRRERREGGSVMVWQNLDQETAEDFFRTYKTRALQVSEILRTKGLW